MLSVRFSGRLTLGCMCDTQTFPKSDVGSRGGREPNPRSGDGSGGDFLNSDPTPLIRNRT